MRPSTHASRTAPAGIVREVDVAEGLSAIDAPRPGIEAFVLVRVFTEPIGLLKLTLDSGRLEPQELAGAIAAELGSRLRPRLERSGLSWSGTIPLDGLQPPHTPDFLVGRERAMREGPSITAAVCTRDRPEGLGDLLHSLAEQAYPRVRVLVVDNAPSDDRTRDLVSSLARTQHIEYVREPRAGLSWARNCALENSDTDVVAWADDDEVCDRWWAAELARGYVEVPQASAVNGLVVPAELQTQSQLWFERFNGVQRGRGFDRAIFAPHTRGQHNPLYPMPPFGIGGNMSVRREAAARIGGFDCALGPGTLSMDGDDTAALSALLLDGETIVYQPSAITYHRHRMDPGVLRHLFLGYGRGLGAYYASMLINRPSSALELLRLTPRALRDQFSGGGDKLTQLGPDFPDELLRANRLGLVQGPFMYLAARIRSRRLAAAYAQARALKP